ncbi:hypothetical protein [Luteimonas saliphila]|uniref:hypothetical protein n=1 Tax=Luteimonas saliphila TaxID=2804919 RepID=UPI00192DC335|nr:hypothetical protein [Luteimonas saliphila]
MKTTITTAIAPLALLLAGCQPGPAGAATDGTAPPEVAPEVVDELPLDRGYYVRSDESCRDASAAGVQLLRRAGLQWVTSHCLFDRIERIDATTYRVTQSCGDHHGAAPAAAVYEIPDRTSFSFVDDQGWEHAARLCPQPEMPEPWRSEDIGELID